MFDVFLQDNAKAMGAFLYGLLGPTFLYLLHAWYKTHLEARKKIEADLKAHKEETKTQTETTQTKFGEQFDKLTTSINLNTIAVVALQTEMKHFTEKGSLVDKLKQDYDALFKMVREVKDQVKKPGQ